MSKLQQVEITRGKRQHTVWLEVGAVSGMQLRTGMEIQFSGELWTIKKVYGTLDYCTKQEWKVQ